AIHISAIPETQQKGIDRLIAPAAGAETLKAATERFAITCAALRPRLLSASPACAFLARPARVETKVRTNSRISGVSPVLRTDSLNDPVQNVMRKQIIPPHIAPPGVAA